MNSGRRRILKWCTTSLIVLLGTAMVVGRLAGCGFAGKGDWVAAPTTRQAPVDLLEGNWIGNWASNQRDMDGELRCKIVKQGEGVYEAKFDAIFAKVFTHESVVTLQVGSKDPAWVCAGEKDLGVLNGGVYTYRGRSDGHEFICDYDSSYDKGTFRLKRAIPTTQSATR